MFEETLLIIKPDYLLKRNPLLMHLLQQGFLIKGQRKTYFTPELAAEFYQDQVEDSSYMFQVILLSKGNSEAFILVKECAVQALINVMVCYFGNSYEMERYIHVTQCLNKVQREITLIFPNYIHEPINCPVQIKFCANDSLVEALISNLYDMVTNIKKYVRRDWKEELAEGLNCANKTLPRILKQCCHSSKLKAQEQTNLRCFKCDNGGEAILERFLSSDLSKDCSSCNFTTSSCLSCYGFDTGSDYVKQTALQSVERIAEARTALYQESSSGSSLQVCIFDEGQEDTILRDVAVNNGLKKESNDPYDILDVDSTHSLVEEGNETQGEISTSKGKTASGINP